MDHRDISSGPEDRPLTLLERLSAVISSPGRVFEELPYEPHRPANWIVPWIILSVTAIIAGAVMLADSSLMAQLSSLTADMFHGAVEEGALSQKDLEWQLRAFGPGSPVFAVLWLTGPPATSLVTMFALAFLLRLIGRSAMSAQAPFMKIVEVVGLTSVVRALETAATLALVLLTGSILATPSAALLAGSFDPESTLQFALSRINPFTFWTIGLTALGLSELFERDFPKVLVLLGALWLLWTGFTLLLSL